jgi:hypothetical protein
MLKAWPPQDAVHDAGKNVAPIPAHGDGLPDMPAADMAIFLERV